MRKSLPINSARSLTASFSITTTNSALSVSPNDYRRRQIRRAKTFVYVLLFSIPVMLLLLYLFVVIMPERPTKAVETTTAKAKFTSHAALRRLSSGLVPNWYNLSIQVIFLKLLYLTKFSGYPNFLDIQKISRHFLAIIL